MFAEDIKPQARKLVQMLALVVNSLHRLDANLQAVEDLARRHNDYGVSTEHYPIVGNTLIWTLEQGPGEAFTPDIRAAWASVGRDGRSGSGADDRPAPRPAWPLHTRCSESGP